MMHIQSEFGHEDVVMLSQQKLGWPTRPVSISNRLDEHVTHTCVPYIDRLLNDVYRKLWHGQLSGPTRSSVMKLHIENSIFCRLKLLIHDEIISLEMDNFYEFSVDNGLRVYVSVAADFHLKHNFCRELYSLILDQVFI